jgi:DNA invertase Pin-like site-specific DNA recombinase
MSHLSDVAAEDMLRRWAEVHAKRDEVIKTAAAAGISVHRIHKITGVARTTITRILSAELGRSDP